MEKVPKVMRVVTVTGGRTEPNLIEYDRNLPPTPRLNPDIWELSDAEESKLDCWVV